MIKRNRNRERRARKQIIDEAVSKSRAPATATPGAARPSGVVDSLIPTTTADENGNTLYTALTDIDMTENAFARTE